MYACMFKRPRSSLLIPLLSPPQARTVHTSHMSQMIAAKLLAEWGAEGFEKHIAKVCMRGVNTITGLHCVAVLLLIDWLD